MIEKRMKQPMFVLPDAMQAMLALHKSAEPHLSATLRGLVHLRASQINGCSVCVEMHARDLRKAGNSEERIATVAAWRETPWFDEAERAVLALTEALTRIADRPDPIPDELWDTARKHFDEKAMAALLIEIAGINVWNRLNVATRQVVGEWKG